MFTKTASIAWKLKDEGLYEAIKCVKNVSVAKSIYKLAVELAAKETASAQPTPAMARSLAKVYSFNTKQEIEKYCKYLVETM